MSRTEWHDCPICGESDTRADVTDSEGWIYICTNFKCGSNGGNNFDNVDFKIITTEYFLRLKSEAKKNLIKVIEKL